ncbi:hypothetical protein LPJ66_000064 [Kickxella alabastrina]|uniref:Uncharacterized protein n=1 Tax=Kickxella alabastrina TaxID=61397 RepID=A0ACC1IX98_9FUNG|nr:hypothetical protein LPJ66_000064 [Kickxella alabastrina]
MGLYTKQDLKDSQELYQNCGFISKKTRSIYAWRAALWVRYCKECKVDFVVTEDKLISYLDWLFEIDLANKINTKKSYVPDILRDHMGSVICLWRIQTGNNSELTSPKEGTRYQAKWDEILRKYPRRERFQSRSYLSDGRSIDSGTDMLLQVQSVFPSGHRAPVGSVVGGSSSSHRGHGEGDYQNSQFHYQEKPQYQYGHLAPPVASSQLAPQKQIHYQPYSPYRYQSPVDHRTQSSLQLPRVQYTQQQQLYPAALVETAELECQLHWLLGRSWAHSVARFLFTVAMSAWIDPADVVGIRLSDIHFASSTMAPHLPSSVLRIAVMTSPVSSQRRSPDNAYFPTPATRQHVSYIVCNMRAAMPCRKRGR